MMSRSGGIEKLVADLSAEFSDECFGYFNYMGEKHSHWSPIETLFYVALYYRAIRDGFEGIRCSFEPEISIVDARERAGGLDYCQMYVFPQCKIDKWRVDFALAI